MAKYAGDRLDDSLLPRLATGLQHKHNCKFNKVYETNLILTTNRKLNLTLHLSSCSVKDETSEFE